MRVMVAMSGGVDSSVAAGLLVEQGYDVVGVTLKQWEDEDGQMPTAGCCTVSDAEDARRVAAQLDIPYYVLDYVDDFKAAVVEPWGRAYLEGRTPNPCVECNRRVRFNTLLERARTLGCEALATGHHARVEWHPSGVLLRMGADPAKDQSYVLHMLTRAQLERIMFPIGHLTKAAVRTEASRLGLRTANKPDSQEICFVGDGNYRDFLRRHFEGVGEPGPIVDTDGERLGTHSGTVDFTIGQRKGLGVALAEKKYVVDIDVATRTVTIGDRADLMTASIDVADVSFVAGAPPGNRRMQVKVRYRSTPEPGRLEEAGAVWRFQFDEPQPGAAPGQAAVFYTGDIVVGGGTIVGTEA